MASLLTITLANVAMAAVLALLAAAVMRWGKRPALAHGLWALALVKLITPQNAWTAEETVGTAATGLSPAVAATAEGDFVVAYRGALNEGIHFVRGKDGAWGAATTIEVPQTPSSAPVALPGLSGADAEIVYATGGTMKHARVNGTQASLADVPGPTNVTNVAATIVP